MSHEFDFYNEQFETIDKSPDNRTEQEKKNSLLSQYNHDHPDIAFAERQAEEMVNLGGAWISLHLRIPNRNQTGSELLWDDDADPMYESPRDFKAVFNPDPIEVELSKWGNDNPVNAKFTFPRAILLKEVGERLLVPGDVIEAPYNIPPFPDNPHGPKYFRILNAAHTGMYRYRWLYVDCQCELITGDKALKPVLRGLNRGTPFVQ